MNATLAIAMHRTNHGFRTGNRLVEFGGKLYSQRFAHWWSWDGQQPVAHTVEGPLFDPKEPRFILDEIDREFDKLLGDKLLKYPVYRGQWKDGRWT